VTLNIVQLIVILLVLGLVIGLTERYLPIPPPFKTIIYVLVVVVACLVLLAAVGLVRLT
jgi:hypothetical protein